MFFSEQSEDYRPLFWLQGRPIYAHVLLVLVHVIAFVVTAICVTILGGDVYRAILLTSDDVVYRGQIWRLASYIIFSPTEWSIWFVFAMGFFYAAGKEVEQYVGRSTFLKLYLALVFIPAVFFCLIGLVIPLGYHLGGMESIFGIFVAFATLYPGITLNIWFTNLSAKAWCWVLLSVYTLVDFTRHDWSSLLILWLCAGVGYGGMRYIGAGRGMDWLTNWLEERRTKKLTRERNFKIVKEKQATDSIDAILEKISKQGVSSLSDQERAALERARTNLLKRDQR